MSWLLGAVSVLVLALGVQTWRVEALQDKAADLKAQKATYKGLLETNRNALDTCQATNLANLQEAKRQRIAAEQAANRAKMLAAELDQRITEIPTEAEQFTDDEKLRVLLPDDFVAWMRE